MSALESMSDAELSTLAHDLHEEGAKLRAKRLEVSKEISFRHAARGKAKALAVLDGMSPEEIKRVRALAQDLKPTGVPSEEKTGSVGG